VRAARRASRCTDDAASRSSRRASASRDHAVVRGVRQQRLAEHELAHGEHAGQRVVELVRDTADQLSHGRELLALHEAAGRAALVGHVAERGHDAARRAGVAQLAQGRGGHGQHALLAVGAHGRELVLERPVEPRAGRPLDERAGLVGAHEVDGAAADQRVAPPEQCQGRRVGVHHPAPAVGDEQRVARVPTTAGAARERHLCRHVRRS
jgi:hypothetical protein